MRWCVELDHTLSRSLAVFADIAPETLTYRKLMRILEWMAHGVPWMVVPAVVLLVSSQLYMKILCISVILAIVLDLLAVAILKILFCRQRPNYNVMDMGIKAPGDQFSFPSGHTSRSVMLSVLAATCFDSKNFGLWKNLLFWFLVLVFPVSVGLSRIMLGRHYVSDVMCGAVLGLLEGVFVYCHWLADDHMTSFLLHSFLDIQASLLSFVHLQF